MYHTGDCESSDNDDHSTGAAVAIGILVTFIIALVVTTLISVIITRICYKYWYEVKEDTKPNDSRIQTNNQFVLMEKDSYYENMIQLI